MRRAMTVLFALSLALSMLAFAPTTGDGDQESDQSTQSESTEEDTDDSITPELVDVAMYFHGQGDRYVDEDSYLDGIAEMDRIEPTSDDFDSKQLLNYAVGPNSQCAGNGLFPVWVGFVGGGTIVGDATVTFDVVGSTGGDVAVNVWADVSGQACNEDYPTPDASAVETLPAGAGTAEVTVPTDGLAPEFYLMVQLQPASDGPGPASFTPTGQARVLYDGADHASSISFTCQPDDVGTEDEAAEADCNPF